MVHRYLHGLGNRSAELPIDILKAMRNLPAGVAILVLAVQAKGSANKERKCGRLALDMRRLRQICRTKGVGELEDKKLGRREHKGA